MKLYANAFFHCLIFEVLSHYGICAVDEFADATLSPRFRTNAYGKIGVGSVRAAGVDTAAWFCGRANQLTRDGSNSLWMKVKLAASNTSQFNRPFAWLYLTLNSHFNGYRELSDWYHLG